MTWVKLTDTFAGDPDWDSVDAESFTTHIAALCYCAAQLTDGRISHRAVRKLPIAADPETSAKELVRIGKWVETEDGYEIVDYLVDQLTADEVRRQRDRKAANMRAYRERKGQTGQSTESDGSSRVDRSRDRSVTGLVTEPPPRPAPPRPEGIRGVGGSGGEDSVGASASLRTPPPHPSLPGEGEGQDRPTSTSVIKINGVSVNKASGRKAR